MSGEVKFSMYLKRILITCRPLELLLGKHLVTMTSGTDDAPVLSIPQGQVQGVRRKTIYDDNYFSFEGIPFGKPPLGDLRFRAPQPAEAWTGVRSCSESGNKPVQINVQSGEVEGSEDCLYISIYIKTLDSVKPLPVMVWIYGGGFYKGEGNRRRHGPDYFMQQEVIMVSFNYRVDALGFLSLADPELEVPGNAGLKDQVLALRWIKQNIAFFNGDENNITVFGESAGGASVHYMAITEQTRGLFHKCILMSGCVLNYWANIPQADFGYRLAKQHGYDGENIDRNVFCFLHNLEAEKLVKHNLLTDADHRHDYFFLFAPTVEPYRTVDCVIPREPLEMMRTAWSNAIPMIVGGTSFEGLLMYTPLKQRPDLTACLLTDPERVLPIDVISSHSGAERKRLAEDIICAHFGDETPGGQSRFEHLDLLSYKGFWHGLHRTTLNRLTTCSAPTYLYRFDFDSPTFNLYRIRYCGTDPVRGAAHTDDLLYIFLFPESRKLAPESPEYRNIQRMIGMWTAFAKNSDPNCAEIAPTVWCPLQPDAPDVALNISTDVEMIQLPESTKLKVWNTLYRKEDLY